MRSNLFPVAKEGMNYILSSAGLLLLSIILDLDIFTFLLSVSTLLFVYIFRNPEREVMNFEKGSLLSPVDGKLLSVEELADNDTYTLKVEIQSNYQDISLLRVPLNAQVSSIQHCNGTRVSNQSDLFSSLNEYVEIVFCDIDNNSLKVSHRLTQSFKSLDINLLVDQDVLQTSRYGVMVSGITTLYLPKNFRLSTRTGESLSAGESLMGYFS